MIIYRVLIFYLKQNIKLFQTLSNIDTNIEKSVLNIGIFFSLLRLYAYSENYFICYKEVGKG